MWCKITVKYPWPLYMRQTQNNSTICTSLLFWLGPGCCMASAAAELETKRLTKSDGRRSFSDSRLGWQKYQVPNQFVPVAKRSCYQNTVPGPQPVSGWYDEVVEGKTTSAVKRSIGSTTGFHNHGEGPYTRAFSWLKAPTSAFTFKTLLRHYAKQALTPWKVNVKLGRQRKTYKRQARWLA